MKRRYHDFNPVDPSPIRISSPATLPKARSPVIRPDSRSNRADGPKTSEFAFFKKLRKDAAGQKNRPHKLSSSECYKVVDGTGVVRNNSKSLEQNDVTKKRTKDLRYLSSVGKTSSKELGSLLSVEKVNSKDSRSALPVKNTTDINFDSFPSPVDRAVNNSEVNLKNAFSVVEPIFSVEDWFEHHSDNKKPGGSCSDEADIFATKRWKLLQWAQNSFPEIEECCSKGYDVVSMLLGRLSPWSTENSYRSAESTPLESNTKSELFACPKSDIPSQKLYRLPTRKILEVEDKPSYLEIGTSSYWSDISRETMISNIDSTTYNNHSAVQKYLELTPLDSNTKSELFAYPKSDIPSHKLFRLPTKKILEVNDTPSYMETGTSSYWSDISRKTVFANIDSTTYNNHTCKLREKDLTSCFDNDSNFGFPFVGHGSFPPFISSEEPDDLHDLNGYLPARESLLTLLEWDSINGTSSYWSDRSRETMCSNIYSPLYNNHRILQKNLESPSYELLQKKLISCIDSDSGVDFPYGGYGPFLPFNSFKEPGHLYDSTGSLPEREPHLPLLEWDSVNKNINSSSATYQNTNWTIIPALQCSWDHQQSPKIPYSSFGKLDDSLDPVGTSAGRELQLPMLEWHSVNVNERNLAATSPNTNWTLIPAVQSSQDHQQSLNNRCESFGALGLYSSPIPGNYPQDFHTLVTPISASYDKQESERSILETEEEMIADTQQLPLALSHSPKCLNLISARNHYEIAGEGSEASGIHEIAGEGSEASGIHEIAGEGSEASGILPSENYIDFMSNE